MKSLEILDDIYIDLEDYLLYMEKDLQERIKNNESEASIIEVSDSIKITQVNMYDKLNKIKADLEDYQELKEILKNHMILNDGFCGLHEERKYTFACKRVLSKKETKFLKQWLEENKNEICN